MLISLFLFIGTMVGFASIPCFIQWYVITEDTKAWKRTRESEEALYKAIEEWRNKQC